jgi:hypothetical protein
MDYLTTLELEAQGKEVVVTSSLEALESRLSNLKRLLYLTRQRRIKAHGAAFLQRIGGSLSHSPINGESQRESSSLRLL